MKVLLDINVMMDVFMQRDGQYEASAKLLSLGIARRIDAVVPEHAPTTVHYLVTRYRNKKKANEAVDWILASFPMAPATRETYLKARTLGFSDFEDAVVATMAESEYCDKIVTRNVADFKLSRVPVSTPEQILDSMAEGGHR